MDKKEELITIMWGLLEAKLAYYDPTAVHPSWKPIVTISDHDYDALENRANVLATELGETFVPYVGLPTSPAMKSVRSKLGHKKTEDMESCITKAIKNGKIT